MDTIHSRLLMTELGNAVGGQLAGRSAVGKDTAPKRKVIAKVAAALETTEDVLLFGREKVAIASPIRNWSRLHENSIAFQSQTNNRSASTVFS